MRVAPPTSCSTCSLPLSGGAVETRLAPPWAPPRGSPAVGLTWDPRGVPLRGEPSGPRSRSRVCRRRTCRRSRLCSRGVATRHLARGVHSVTRPLGEPPLGRGLLLLPLGPRQDTGCPGGGEGGRPRASRLLPALTPVPGPLGPEATPCLSVCLQFLMWKMHQPQEMCVRLKQLTFIKRAGRRLVRGPRRGFIQPKAMQV